MIQQRRGKNVALGGAFCQFVFSAVMLVIWLWTGSAAALSCLCLLVGGLGVWLMAALLLYCRELEKRESLELEEIAAAAGPGETIFAGDAGGEMRVAARRLRIVERWLVPVFTLLWAGYHVAVGAAILRYLGRSEPVEIQSPAQGALFLAMIGFVAFLLSFYALGMGKRPQWRVMRAVGGYVLVNVLFIAATAVVLLGVWQGYRAADRIVAYAIPLVQLLFAAELVVNFILELYRPRVPGRQERFSFDSRIFALIADPQRVGASIADALNYQFGFEVSRSWFYQLVSRAFLPLIAFGVVVLLAMSSVVIVREGERYVVQRWGRLDPARKTLEPGLRLKWPWPIETATRFNVARVREILIGSGQERDRAQRRADVINGREFFLWTREHGRYEELDFLVAVPPREGEERAPGSPLPKKDQGQAEAQKRIPAVQIIKLVVSVQYVIDDVYRYGFGHVDTPKVLEAVAYREMTNYCASATLDTPVPGAPPDRPQAIMTSGRGELAEALKKRIVAAADRLDLGVRITYVGVVSVHPPADAAPAYEAVIESKLRMEEKRYEADAKANRALSELAGDPTTALLLAGRFSALQELEQLQKVRADRKAFSADLDGFIGTWRESIEVLAEQRKREKLLGRGRGGEKTRTVRLLQACRAHLRALQQVRAEMEKGSPPDLTSRIAPVRDEADRLFSETAGTAAAMVEKAGAVRWRKELGEAGRYEWFTTYLRLYNANREVFLLHKWLEIWDEVLPRATKYVLGVDRNLIEVRWNLQREESPIKTGYEDKESRLGE